ncbi:MAG: hypothetical protein AAFY88_21215 [Acidobacteriota bacterium]
MADGMNAAEIVKVTDPDLDKDSLCDREAPHVARTEFAINRADRIVVFSRGGSQRVEYDDDAGNWILKPSGGFARDWFVVMPADFSHDATLLSHELGHYFNSPHTFDDAVKPADISEAATFMQQWAATNPQDDPTAVFDFDARWDPPILDTPPDPSTALVAKVYGSECSKRGATISVPVSIGGQQTTFKLTPDRANVMSYFKHCPNIPRFYLSEGQLANAMDALAGGNRSHLLTETVGDGKGTGGSCYGSVSHGSTSHRPKKPATPKPPGLTPEDLRLSLRKLAACLVLAKDPLPWETVMGGIYSNPAERRPGFTRLEGLAVHEVREQKWLASLLERPPIIE